MIARVSAAVVFLYLAGCASAPTRTLADVIARDCSMSTFQPTQSQVGRVKESLKTFATIDERAFRELATFGGKEPIARDGLNHLTKEILLRPITAKPFDIRRGVLYFDEHDKELLAIYMEQDFILSFRTRVMLCGQMFDADDAIERLLH